MCNLVWSFSSLYLTPHPSSVQSIDSLYSLFTERVNSKMNVQVTVRVTSPRHILPSHHLPPSVFLALTPSPVTSDYMLVMSGLDMLDQDYGLERQAGK